MRSIRRIGVRKLCLVWLAYSMVPTAAYFNSELRLSLFSVGGEVLPGTWGAIGFVDQARVWTDGEASSTWHSGYGGGIWYDIFGEIVVRFTMGKSPEGTSILFGTGFLF